MKKLAFFHGKGGVGQTTFIYHLGHMLVEQGQRVLLVDLDPLSSLTALCVPEERLEALWPEQRDHKETIVGSLAGVLSERAQRQPPHLEELREGLALLPGDLGLSAFENQLGPAWASALRGEAAGFALISALHRAIELAARRHTADVVLFDCSPHLGALNRTALLAADLVVTPLSSDLFSIEGLRTLGQVLSEWRAGWLQCLAHKPAHDLELPDGRMQPLGYLIMQAMMVLGRPWKANERWRKRVAADYHRAVLHEDTAPPLEQDPYYLGAVSWYHTLLPLARDARKPIFELRPADGALGAQMTMVQRSRTEFATLSQRLLERAELLLRAPARPGSGQG